MVEPDTAEAIAAAKTIFAELAVATVGAVLGVVRHVAIGAVDAFGAPFATDAERESAAAHALAGVASVVHIFGIEDAKAVVAILAAHRFREVAVFRAVLDKVIARFS